MKNSKRIFLFFSGLVAIVLLAPGIIFSIRFYQYEHSKNFYNAYMTLYADDTIGGKTPEETLKFFVDALKNGDVDLASKYFVLDDHGSREKWVNYLQSVQSKNLLSRFAADIETKSTLAGASYQGNLNYKILNSNGVVNLFISLVSKDGLWKIESL